MQPIVSIIVPCYNQAHFLNESLQSVLDQTYENWECIIVNDGSPDDTKSVSSLWLKKDSRFSYLEKHNGGLSSARNEGIRVSKGMYILPLDADDILHENYLSKTVPRLESDCEVAIVSCYSIFFSKHINRIVNKHKPKGNSNRALLYVNQLVATSLFRKMCWEEVGGYDETMKNGFEDWEFWLAITKSGWNYDIVKEFLFFYRKAEKSMLVNTVSNHLEVVKQYIITKHRELYIMDFDNCVKVFTHDLKTSRSKGKRLQQSLEYKIGKVILKPYRWMHNVISKASPSDE